MSLTRAEWVTLSLFVLALALNLALVIQEKSAEMCVDEVGFRGSLHTSCEEEESEEIK
jgi:hypothetical protein